MDEDERVALGTPLGQLEDVGIPVVGFGNGEEGKRAKGKNGKILYSRQIFPCRSTFLLGFYRENGVFGCVAVPEDLLLLERDENVFEVRRHRKTVRVELSLKIKGFL